ncbi:hypothetical protein TTHERM_00298360 (macronuclear) [Tetrahymena thermophila SB210]|uniref:Uncharacterized protein n=1 Tax=Tetrahymena thermophila (strain SB210) TaxID=312017 RepID=I7MM60_TETTS|nr:hypothetical protein TTHERM_00298360 [Tetrahymena thermophila SB210]EAS04225.1 hypothetical protein TTHERM_00298360 [Tetrahymena thermophila SB210]|eukprot:XP_001024470.1 hypothetical protein TTHERM_00298360 [Tetrahymena thermophila SB210]
MNIIYSIPSFAQQNLNMPFDSENNEYDNNNMTFSSLDENNSTQSQNHLQLNNNNSASKNYFSCPFNPNKVILKNSNSKEKFTNIQPCNLFYNLNSEQASDFFYAFNVLPINLNYLSGKKNFSFLSELNRNVDICEMSSDTKAVHIFYQDIAVLPQTYSLINNLSVQEEKYQSFAQKLQLAAQLTINMNNSVSSCNSQQNTFGSRSKNIINEHFASKKDKRMFALSGSFNPKSSRHQFSVHFSQEMIHILGYETDSFMLKCSITGFNEFMMTNEFISNMQTIIEALPTQIMTSSQNEPLKIKQKFYKSQDEAMEAVFSVYLLKGSSLQSISESIIVFEILHILDFQVSTKGKKFVTKKRQFDVSESVFIERYLKTLNQVPQQSDFQLDETSGESRNDTSSKKTKKSIQKASKTFEKGQQKRKSRKAKDFISY